MGTFAAVGVSSSVRVKAGSRLLISISGTFVQKIALEKQDGAVWRSIREYRADGADDALPVETEAQYYRLNCYARTSGTSTYSLDASAVSAAPAAPALDDGSVVAILRINEAGNLHVIRFLPGTETADRDLAIPALGAGVHTIAMQELSQLWTGPQVFGSNAAAAGLVAASFGPSSATGLLVKVIDEVVSLAAAGAKYKAMTTAIPAGAVILSVQANIDVLAVAGGTSVKVGIGDHAGVTNTYGNTSALTKNLKIDTIPAYAVLAGATTLDVCACASTASGLGDTNFSAGSVRVRVVYLARVSLPDA